MFTGIIETVSHVISLRHEEDCLVVRIKKPSRWRLTLGQSVALDGVCATVTQSRPTFFEVVFMPETLKKTIVSEYKPGSPLNLERTLTLNRFIDGHLVSGHVDACGVVKQVVKSGLSRTLTVTLPRSLRRYVAARGSITLNGTSLTVARVVREGCVVALIPYTLTHTNLGVLSEGSKVNVEVDLMARYLERLIASV